MKKTLIVSYTPREGSNTKKLLDHFVSSISGKTEVEYLDLAEKAPAMFLKEELNAYVKRNFGGQELSEEEQKVLEPIDKMCQQVLDADYIVLAYPIYNFTFPGPVKCWFDAILQSGKTFKYTEKGFEGMLKHKKGLAITTSGGDYTSNSAWDFSTPLVHGEFEFMGMESKVVTAGGMSMDDTRSKDSLEKAIVKLDHIASEWFK
jgi:FMN-dependent NADH-azoreductase